ncbi:MAG: hypothetical protein FWG87_07995 [Defluviitaleaceae bacterium]|nr:hypothetical protein [Defluviitaleaceae bacterium]
MNADLADFKGNGTRIYADYADFVRVNLLNGDIFYHEPIRKIRVNPLNPCSTTFNSHG